MEGGSLSNDVAPLQPVAPLTALPPPAAPAAPAPVAPAPAPAMPSPVAPPSSAAVPSPVGSGERVAVSANKRRRLELAAKAVVEDKMKVRVAAEQFSTATEKLSKSSVQRAVKAYKEGRNVGTAGQPPLLTTESLASYVDMMERSGATVDFSTGLSKASRRLKEGKKMSLKTARKYHKMAEDLMVEKIKPVRSFVAVSAEDYATKLVEVFDKYPAFKTRPDRVVLTEEIRLSSNMCNAERASDARVTYVASVNAEGRRINHLYTLSEVDDARSIRDGIMMPCGTPYFPPSLPQNHIQMLNLAESPTGDMTRDCWRRYLSTIIAMQLDSSRTGPLLFVFDGPSAALIDQELLLEVCPAVERRAVTFVVFQSSNMWQMMNNGVFSVFARRMESMCAAAEQATLDPSVTLSGHGDVGELSVIERTEGVLAAPNSLLTSRSLVWLSELAWFAMPSLDARKALADAGVWPLNTNNLMASVWIPRGATDHGNLPELVAASTSAGQITTNSDLFGHLRDILGDCTLRPERALAMVYDAMALHAPETVKQCHMQLQRELQLREREYELNEAVQASRARLRGLAGEEGRSLGDENSLKRSREEGDELAAKRRKKR